MTLVDGVWYDNELNYKYGDHKFALLPNSMAGKTMNSIPIIVGMTSNSVTMIFNEVVS
ncbi:MAG: hypothetical protein OEL69_09030 [Nitrosopumilus sp.]|nr:hypothetical protein [Nitrosopumilus sp.]